MVYCIGDIIVYILDRMSHYCIYCKSYTGLAPKDITSIIHTGVAKLYK